MPYRFDKLWPNARKTRRAARPEVHALRNPPEEWKIVIDERKPVECASGNCGAMVESLIVAVREKWTHLTEDNGELFGLCFDCQEREAEQEYQDRMADQTVQGPTQSDGMLF